MGEEPKIISRSYLWEPISWANVRVTCRRARMKSKLCIRFCY